jgi:hypothetical protein
MRPDISKALDYLQNEEPVEPDREDASRWLEVYTQLIEMTVRTLAQTREQSKALAEPARRYVLHANVDIMEQELARFYERRRVWAERLNNLSE